MLTLIPQENSFKFTNKHFLQPNGTTMGTKAAVGFVNIFMAKIENQILQQSKHKPPEWVRFIDDIASFWDVSVDEVKQFIEEANRFHPTIKFTASISYTEATFLDTTIYKGNHFKQQGILDVQTRFKPTGKFQYTRFKSSHPPSVKKGFIKGEALRLLRTCSSKEQFESISPILKFASQTEVIHKL